MVEREWRPLESGLHHDHIWCEYYYEPDGHKRRYCQSLKCSAQQVLLKKGEKLTKPTTYRRMFGKMIEKQNSRKKQGEAYAGF